MQEGTSMRYSEFLSRRLPAAAAVVLALAAGAGGAAFAASTTTVSTKSTDTVVSTKANTSLASTAGTETSILTLHFPKTSSATKYVLTAHGDAVNGAGTTPFDYVRCTITVNGTQIAVNATTPGGDNPVGAFGLTGGVRVPAKGGTAVLQCEHDHAGSTFVVDAGASLWAHRTSSLTVATE